MLCTALYSLGEMIEQSVFAKLISKSPPGSSSIRYFWYEYREFNMVFERQSGFYGAPADPTIVPNHRRGPQRALPD